MKSISTYDKCKYMDIYRSYSIYVQVEDARDS